MRSPRRKVSTLLDDALYRRAKLEALRQGKPVSQILSEALAAYLQASGPPAGGGVVAETWGNLRIEPHVLRELLGEEDWLGSRS